MDKYFSLADLSPGGSAEVIRLNTEGSMKIRLLDMGLTPGTVVKCVGRSPLGDPAAFLIRGTVIALRDEDSKMIEAAPLGQWKKTVVLAGNPNVGKSTVFNALTGMKQHTGNWQGKTVACACGKYSTGKGEYTLVDIPGTYSLAARSREEKEASEFLLSDEADCVVVVCDAACLERNLNLAIQIMEICPRVIVCINMMDEARKRHIEIDFAMLSEFLGVPVTGITARRKETIRMLTDLIDQVAGGELLCENTAGKRLRELRNNPDADHETAAAFVAAMSEEICRKAVKIPSHSVRFTEERVDRIVTGKISGFVVMALMLTGVLWFTIKGANYPSQLLSGWFSGMQEPLSALLLAAGMPVLIHDMLIYGVYRVVSWVVSVMLPPMAIFFPLFTLLEDLGFLPRIAYNLDRAFRCCGACGKQALTACMGLGCNAAGVTGCRIIDSPRERMLAVLTNSFVPCNGKFAALIAVITMFFAGSSWAERGENSAGLKAALILACFITGSILLMLAATKVLSSTLLKGMPSSFTLELPPYRCPQIGKVLVRSVLDRTVFVLGRAVAAAAPAGLAVWALANIKAGNSSLLYCIVEFFDPLGRLMGLDGAILTAFILGIPANEIVIPVIIMIYSSGASIESMGELADVYTLFVQSGWTGLTALCTLIFFVAHWPCATTLLTVKKETGSLKWTFAAWAVPTICGFILCTAAATIFG